MKRWKCAVAALLSTVIVSVGLISAGPPARELAEPNATDNPFLYGFLAEREPRERLEGQFSNGQECRSAVLRELLGATDEQWREIEPRVNELEAVRVRTRSAIGSWVAFSRFGTGSESSYRSSQEDAGGGYNDSRSVRPLNRSVPPRRVEPQRPVRPSAGAKALSQGAWRSSQRPPAAKVTGGLRLCGELLDMVDRADVSAEEIREKMAQLAAYRRQADEEIKQAQQALRQVVNRRQEAMLILMGHLD